MVKQENLFSRDHRFSMWHRTLKHNWYFQDMDHIIWQVTDSKAKCLALIEEKHHAISELDLNSYQIQAHQDLAGSRPFFVMLSHYNETKRYFTFYIIAANKAAKKLLKKAIGKDRRYLSELDYIRFEAYLRKEKPPVNDRACVLIDKFELPGIKDMHE